MQSDRIPLAGKDNPVVTFEIMRRALDTQVGCETKKTAERPASHCVFTLGSARQISEVLEGVKASALK